MEMAYVIVAATVSAVCRRRRNGKVEGSNQIEIAI